MTLRENFAPSVQSLFRQQAIEFLSTKQYGTVLLARPVSHLFLTWLFLAIALAIVAFFIFFSTTRKAQSQGVLLPTSGVIRIMPGQAGVIAGVRVKEGQAVRAGEVLFVLSGERSSLVGDIGSGLSGGQKQRILLARALYKNPSLLVLDEATSHLDVWNEQAVNAAIQEIQLTRVIVAHRPETIAMAQRVVVLHQGKVVQDVMQAAQDA